nr:ATP-binding cassette domain-containing protein [Porphyromonas cangingivalis]
MIEAKNINFYYGYFHALKGISMHIKEKTVTAFIGPSGCGKSTFLRLFNRMNDLIPDTSLTGQCLIDGMDIYDKSVQIDDLRKKVGMVFQKPNPFPKSIFENVAYGLRVNDMGDKHFITQSRRVAQSRSSVGRGEGQTEEVGVRTLRRSATKALYRPSLSRLSLNPAHG